MRVTLISALATALCAMSFALSAQTSISAQAFAEVVSTITAQEADALSFGRFSPQSDGGRIVLKTDGTFVNEGSVVLNQSSLIPGSFFITGEPQTAFSIQLPASSARLVHENGESAMVVEGWVSDPPANAGAMIQNNGTQMVKIGAELQIGSLDTNPTGIYSGSFELIFAYN